MDFGLITFGIILWMVTQTCSVPVKNSTMTPELRRSKRESSMVPEDMNAMDKILKANGRRGISRARGLYVRDGDIASRYYPNSRSAITCPAKSCLWPKSVDGFVYVPYIISPSYGRYLTILRLYSASCWSFLGRTEGPQPLSLQSPGCMWSGIASHEFMHALGFVHEQSRSDRDRYVTIVWDNIIQGQEHNFKKYPTNNLNTIYDYSSVMHYGRFAFSEDGGPTIIPKPDPWIPIGQREGPSRLDIHKINLLYECGGLI
ncbi:hypothetical protein DPEC_G00135400 [Dallia pectoralis]|uniref:Uncharacterized protein n=1 Tax=Dallia pectoralis TaxID=75939 RepID=A0ACC2GKY4_DALPE|nr:hypothetical protein DPEC_G00135400 [Dallia pectoralis]